MNGYLEIYNCLSEKEKMDSRNRVLYRACTNCTNPDCRVEYDEKIGLDEFGQKQGSECLGWINEEMIVQEQIKVLRKIK